MVKRDQFVLYVGACPHFLRGAEQHPHLPGAHLAEQFFFLGLCVSGMDVGYFFSRYALSDQLVTQVIAPPDWAFLPA